MDFISFLSKYWVMLATICTVIIWSVRLEGKVNKNAAACKENKDLLVDHKEVCFNREKNKEKKFNEIEVKVQEKFDQTQKSLSEISHCLGRIEGKLEIMNKKD